MCWEAACVTLCLQRRGFSLERNSLLLLLWVVSHEPHEETLTPQRCFDQASDQLTQGSALPTVAPYTRMCSIETWTPSSPCRVSIIFPWKITGAVVMPNGSRLKWKRPNGVTEVVSSQLSRLSGILKEPLAASSGEKVVAPLSSPL